MEQLQVSATFRRRRRATPRAACRARIAVPNRTTSFSDCDDGHIERGVDVGCLGRRVQVDDRTREHRPRPTQFHSGDTPWAGFPRSRGCLYVHPASVALVHEQVRASVRFEWGVEEREWGREVTLRDSDGYLITFSEDIDPGAGGAG